MESSARVATVLVKRAEISLSVRSHAGLSVTALPLLTFSKSVPHETEVDELTLQESTTQIRPFGLFRDLRNRVHWVCAYVCRNVCVETFVGSVGGRNVTPSRRVDTLNLCHVQNLAWSNSQCKRAWHRYVYVVLADISQAVCIGFMHMFAETCV